jgi:hypothetical protein
LCISALQNVLLISYNYYVHNYFGNPMKMNGETDNEVEEGGLTTLEELEAPDEGPGIWFILVLGAGIIAGIVIIGTLIFWLIGRM